MNAWLAGWCVVNALTLLIIASRSLARHKAVEKFRSDDYLMVISGVLVIFPHTVAQIGHYVTIDQAKISQGDSDHSSLRLTSIFGHLLIISYFLVCSTIKVSVCYCILHILPQPFRYLRLSVYLLVYGIIGLGTAISLVHLFRCRPIQSNFSDEIDSESCVDYVTTDISWILISVGFDIILICIPLSILYRAKLQHHQRGALIVVFTTSILGTICCACRLYVYLGYSGSKGLNTLLRNLEISETSS